MRPHLRRDPAGRELRVVMHAPEIRAVAADGAISFVGHAAVFNSRSVVLSDWWDTFQETIEPGAFAGVLDHDVRLLIDHNSSLILARTTAGNLRLSEDEQGLLVEAEITPTSYARDLEANMRAGNITQMSFAFEVDPDGERWEMDQQSGMLLRTISRVIELYDVSPVTYPAYPETDATMRAARSAMHKGRSLLEARTGARNSAADTAVLRTAIDDLHSTADELESLLTEEESEPDEEQNAARAAQQDDIRRDQERHYRAFAALHGLKA